MAPATRRLFLAVFPPPAAIASLETFSAPLRDLSEAQGYKSLRWTTPERWHITLRFLGNATSEEVMEALEDFTAAPCTVSLGPATESLGRGVLMLPASGLEDLAKRLIALTAEVGRPPEDRDFRGHLTLARSRERIPKLLLGRQSQATFIADEIHLAASTTSGASQAPYEIIARWALK